MRFPYYEFNGWDLDDVLEGADPMPIVDPVDRAGQFVYLPPLTAEERAAQAAADEASRIERRRAGAKLAEQYALERERTAGRRLVLPPNMPRPDASLTADEVDALVAGGWPEDPRWRGRRLTPKQAATLEVERQRKRAAVRDIIERHLAKRVA